MTTRTKTGHGWPHDVTKKDLRIIGIRGGGNGGQNRNKVSTGVRLVHVPTGIAAEATEYRDRPHNLKAAFRKLADQIVPLMKKEERRARWAFGFERVRTYHEPDNRVVDELLGLVGSYSGGC